MSYKYIEVSVTGRIARVALNRPDKRNALNYPTITELKDAFVHLAERAEVKVIILQGNGKVFSAGADLEFLQKLQEYSLAENLADSTHLMELLHLLYKHPKPIIAQVQGAAIAGGCGLVTVCDFAFATTDAKFGYTEVKIGFIPALVMIFLVRKLGEAHARRLALSGDLIDAAEAQQLGLITQAVPTDALESHVQAFAERLCDENAAGAMEITKKMLADLQDMPLKEALTFAAKMNAHARGTDECKAGIRAFLNKEKLVW
jgi:methylglutaconyl-CoA hydratase